MYAIGFMLKKIGACGILKNCPLKLRKILPWVFCFDKINVFVSRPECLYSKEIAFSSLFLFRTHFFSISNPVAKGSAKLKLS